MNRPWSLTYILFGKGEEIFLSHYLIQSPEYMHLLLLEEKPNWLSPEQIEVGVLINFPKFNEEDIHRMISVENSMFQVQYEGKDPLYTIFVKNGLWYSLVES